MHLFSTKLWMYVVLCVFLFVFLLVYVSVCMCVCWPMCLYVYLSLNVNLFLRCCFVNSLSLFQKRQLTDTAFISCFYVTIICWIITYYTLKLNILLKVSLLKCMINKSILATLLLNNDFSINVCLINSNL